MKGYSTREVAELIDLPEKIIRDIARGVLNPERTPNQQFRFNFQDIVLLRTAKELLSAGVRRSKINRSLFELQQRLPSNRPLTSLRIAGDAGEVVIREEDQLYNPRSGQLHFNFAIKDLAGSVAPLARRAAEEAEASDHLSSDDWYDLGVDLEAVSPDDAPAAYLRALKLEPGHSDAHVNLGRLCQESDEFEQAEQHYNLALAAEPQHALAAFNLGTLMEDLGRYDDAITAYGIAKTFADAHYNLSRLFELTGRHHKALEHLKIYKTLTDIG